MGASINLISLSTLRATGISERNIQGCLLEVTWFRGKGEYTACHFQLWLKVGPVSSLVHFLMVKIKVSHHILLGRPWLHKHRLIPSTYHQCVKGRLNCRMIRIAANPSPFKQVVAHLVKTIFYDKWAPSGESLVSKPQGTFVPRWEDVQDDPELDLKGLLIQGKKRKEVSTLESNNAPQCVKVQTLMVESFASYKGEWGSHAICKGALDKDRSIKA